MSHFFFSFSEKTIFWLRLKKELLPPETGLGLSLSTPSNLAPSLHGLSAEDEGGLNRQGSPFPETGFEGMSATALRPDSREVTLGL